MPKIAASVSDEDIRRSYYETAGYSMWITEMQLDPLQLIVADDSTGKNFRVPVTLDKGDFAFGDPVEVQVQYVDSGKATKASAITYSSREDSTRGLPEQKPPTAAKAEGSKEGASVDAKKMREALGLAADASDEELAGAIIAQLAAASTPPTPPTPTPAPTPTPTPAPAPTPAPEATLPPAIPAAATAGVQYLDSSTLAALQASARRGEDAFRRLAENEAEQVIKAAIQEGKFAPAREQHWRDLWAADPEGTKDTISKLAKNVIPVSASGFPGVGEEGETDVVYRSLYPEGV